MQIEEHWELAVGEPDAQLSAPQATMVMSPHENLDGQYFVFTINHRSVPSYEPGGMQVQLWNGNDAVDAESSSAAAVRPVERRDSMGTAAEGRERHPVVRSGGWFVRLRGAASAATEVWPFHRPRRWRVSTAIRPAISLTESQVGYAGNRVQRLLLKKLVWLTDDGETHELHAPIDIDADLDP